MIVCHCAGVSDSTIARVIQQGAASVADVTALTGAGRCCSPCREEIANLLSSTGAASASRGLALESNTSSPTL